MNCEYFPGHGRPRLKKTKMNGWSDWSLLELGVDDDDYERIDFNVASINQSISIFNVAKMTYEYSHYEVHSIAHTEQSYMWHIKNGIYSAIYVRGHMYGRIYMSRI